MEREAIVPDTVLEVSYEPELDLLYIRFGRVEGMCTGSYIGYGVVATICGDREERVVAAEITSLRDFLKHVEEAEKPSSVNHHSLPSSQIRKTAQ